MKNKLEFTKAHIVRAIGVMLFFLNIILLLSPFTMLYPISYWMLRLGGFAIYYFVYPVLAAIGVVLFLGKNPNKVLGINFYIGAALVFIGLGFMFGSILNGLGGDGLSNAAEVFRQGYIDKVGNPKALLFVNDIAYSAGIIFANIVIAISSAVPALPGVLAGVLIVLGVVVCLIKQIVLLVAMLIRKASQNKAQRESEKEIQRQNVEINEDIAISIREEMMAAGVLESDDPNPFEDVPTPAFKQNETVLPSRLAANRQHPTSGYNLPSESDDILGIPDISEVSAFETGTMKPAVFLFDGEEQDFGSSSLSEEHLESADSSFEADLFGKPEILVQEEVKAQEQSAIQEEPHYEEPKQALTESPLNDYHPYFQEEVAMEETARVQEPEPLYEAALSYEPEPTYEPEPVVVPAPEPTVYEEENESEIDDLLSDDESYEEEEEIEEEVVAPAPIVNEPAPAPSPAPVKEEPLTEEQILEQTLAKLKQEKESPLPPYTLPSPELLNVYENDQNLEQIEADCMDCTNIINNAFQNLNVGAQVVGHTIGPSVTRYDVQPDPSVSVSSIGKYMKDVSMRLGGVNVRFEEIVRGKSTAGIEVANIKSTIVSLKEMVSSMDEKSKSPMTVPFGKSISGDYIDSDITKFPHLLAAGTTGSGKSIFMHGLIMSLIMRNRPEECKIVLVDPKRVEMSKYKNLPHLLCPIIKEPSEAKVCMDKLIEEMERRNKVFEACDVRDIGSFNKFFAPSHGYKKMPYIVVFVDEYADLSDSCKTIGESVVRIAQKARSAGIHLVIATQRPSVQVITGVIKANIPVRVALSMASSTDSMTIIGQGGAEELNGHGDMLVECPNISRGLSRVQGCLVDDFEIDRVVKFIKGQNLGTMYNENFLDLVDHEAEAKAAEAAMPQVSAAEIKAQSNQDFYENVKEAIMAQEYASISKIQRMFSVGFTRAGKLFSQLQNDGIVARQPDNPSSAKGCKVLVHVDPNNDLSDIKLGSDN